jgi:molybdate transport system regulatory protein
MSDLTPPRLRLRLLFGDNAMLGPGKADLLEAIAATGSIAAAGRAMGMSYKRAWSLVEDMNAAFKQPLVLTARGGAAGGGAQLSAEGAQVVALYRQLMTRIATAGEAEITALQEMLVDMSDGK